MINFLFGLFTPTEFIYLKPVKLSKFIIDPLLKMNNALYNPRNPVTHQPYRIPFNMVVYTCIIASIGIIVYLVVKYITDLTIKNTVLQKHNTEINEQIELLKKHTMEMDERIALLHKTDEKNNEQIELLKPQITELNIHNDEMSIRYDTSIQELSELVGLVVIENDISAKIQTTVSNITKYFEFFEKLSEHLGEERYRDMFIHNSYKLFKPYDLPTHRHICISSGFKGQHSFNPFTHTPILMKYFSKYYHTKNDRFYPLEYKAWGGVGENSSKKYSELYLNFERFDIYSRSIFQDLTGRSSIGDMLCDTSENSKRHITLLNRGIVQLLHETNEEFELKILNDILIQLEDIYVFYKQCEMIGMKKVLELPF